MSGIISKENPKSPISEAYRGIRTSIEFSNLDKEIKVINVTSSRQNEGKTTVTSNLAVTFANLEKKVLLIDGDLRNPSIHRMFGISNIHGLTDVLINNKTFADCINITKQKNLHVLTCGAVPPNPSEMLSSKRMKEFIAELREHYDYIFLDTPPIGVVTDAGIVSTFSDGCVFVVGAGDTDVEMAKIAKERLDKVGANILGAVLNKFETKASGYDYYNYYYQETTKSGRGNKKKK